MLSFINLKRSKYHMKPSEENILNTYKRIPKDLIIRIEGNIWFNSNKFYEDLSYIIAKTIGDGHICKNLGKVQFTDGNKENLPILKEYLINNFSLEPRKIKLKESTAKGKKWDLIISDSLFVRLLFSAGAPSGKKL